MGRRRQQKIALKRYGGRLQTSDSTALDASDMPMGEWMTAVMEALEAEYHDPHDCERCGGIGVEPVMCCDGRECGCMAMPIDFRTCSCGSTPPKWWREGLGKNEVYASTPVRPT